MYLKTLEIKNFRCIKNLCLNFQEGLNVLIGENNTGKSAVLDAIRLCLSIGSPTKDIFLSIDDDFHIDSYGIKSDEIEILLTFSGVSEEEAAIFYEMISIDDKGVQELKLNVRYWIEERFGEERLRFKCWGGDLEGQGVPPEIMELFYYIYLGALRDAEGDLRPIRGNRLGQLFLKLVDESDKENLADSLNRQISQARGWNELINKAQEAINVHLENSSIIDEVQKIDIDFIPYEFKRIVENLRMSNPFSGFAKKEEIEGKFGESNLQWKKYFNNPDNPNLQFKEDLREIIELDEDLGVENKDYLIDIYNRTHRSFMLKQNGLGFNNLIYIATVYGDLFKRRSREKEAYVALLIEEPEAHLHPQLQNTLFNHFKSLGTEKIQVFLTSHSPTITAKTDLDSVSVLHYYGRTLKCIPIKKCPLKDKDKKYLQRFLDVTKSQLFFSKGVILIEGISEALLLPIFAEMMGEGYDLDKNGIEIVNVGGVSFEPFAKLFNSEKEEERLNVKCSILTDTETLEGEPFLPRVDNIKSLRGSNLEVFLARKTFEYELFIFGKNKNILIKVYSRLHPQTKFEIKGNLSEQGMFFLEKLVSNKDKAILAQSLALELKEKTDIRKNFRVPDYIQRAIKWAIKK